MRSRTYCFTVYNRFSPPSANEKWYIPFVLHNERCKKCYERCNVVAVNYSIRQFLCALLFSFITSTYAVCLFAHIVHMSGYLYGWLFFRLAVAFGTEHTSSERNPNNIYWIEEYLYTHTHTPCHIRSNDSQMKSTEHLESLGSGCAIELGQFYCEEKGNIHMCPAITMITFRIEWNAGRNK